MSPRGGARDGSGPKLKDPAGRAKMASYRLPPSTVLAIRSYSERLGISQAQVIARALRLLEETENHGE
jgi:hypothetical protein